MNENEYQKALDKFAATINEDLAANTMDVTMTLTEWLAVHGNLVLALRHPKNNGPTSERVRAIVAELGDALVKTGFISREAMDFAINFEKAHKGKPS